MSTYQSVQSASIEGDTLTITKPTGLAVGDLMVAGIWVSDDGGSTVTLSQPAGWSTVANIDPSSGSQGEALAVFYKVADSSDVAASNFSFTAGGGAGSNHMIGHLLRITNYGLIENSASNTASSGTTLTITGFTPTRADCLFIVFSGTDSTITSPTVTSAVMATNNPSWTERAEVGYNDTTKDSSLAVYTASRPETTATGNFTITYSSADAQNLSGIVLALAPRVDGSVTPTTPVSAYAFTPISGTDTLAVVDAPTTSSRNSAAAAVNVDKPTAATINNIPK